MRFLWWAGWLLGPLLAGAQSKYTVNGYIKDSSTGESVIGATISVVGQQKAVSSNQYGFYSLTLEEGSYQLSVAHVSYLTRQLDVALRENRELNFNLAARSTGMSEVVVYSRRRDGNIKNAQMGRIDLSVTQDRKSVV